MKEDKLDISKQVCNRLIRKIRADLKHTVDNENETVHRLDPRYIPLKIVYNNDVERPKANLLQIIWICLGSR